jgi:hypothetical protein
MVWLENLALTSGLSQGIRHTASTHLFRGSICYDPDCTLFSRGDMLYTTALRALLSAKTPVSVLLAAALHLRPRSITYVPSP